MKYVYKIVSALCAVAILPVTLFSSLIYYYFSSTALESLYALGEYMGSQTIADSYEKYGLESAPTGISDSLSLYEVYDLIRIFSGGEASPEVLENVKNLLPPLLATITAFILILICAIVTVVLVFACKDNRKVTASSFAGVGLSLLFVMLFDNLVSPFVNGTLSISEVFENSWFDLLAEVEEISISPEFYLIPALFGFIALWTILYNATLPEKEKAERQKMIG